MVMVANSQRFEVEGSRLDAYRRTRRARRAVPDPPGAAEAFKDTRTRRIAKKKKEDSPNNNNGKSKEVGPQQRGRRESEKEAPVNGGKAVSHRRAGAAGEGRQEAPQAVLRTDQDFEHSPNTKETLR